MAVSALIAAAQLAGALLAGRQPTDQVGAAALQNLSLLVCPSIQVSLEAVESALAQHLPAMEVAGQPAGGQDVTALRAEGEGACANCDSVYVSISHTCNECKAKR